jgi:hypothetical protein
MKTRKRIKIDSVDKMDALIDEYAEFDSDAIEWHAKMDWILDKAERYCAAMNDVAQQRSTTSATDTLYR